MINISLEYDKYWSMGLTCIYPDVCIAENDYITVK